MKILIKYKRLIFFIPSLIILFCAVITIPALIITEDEGWNHYLGLSYPVMPDSGLAWMILARFSNLFGDITILKTWITILGIISIIALSYLVFEKTKSYFQIAIVLVIGNFSTVFFLTFHRVRPEAIIVFCVIFAYSITRLKFFTYFKNWQKLTFLISLGTTALWNHYIAIGTIPFFLYEIYLVEKKVNSGSSIVKRLCKDFSIYFVASSLPQIRLLISHDFRSFIINRIIPNNIWPNDADLSQLTKIHKVLAIPWNLYPQNIPNFSIFGRPWRAIPLNNYSVERWKIPNQWELAFFMLVFFILVLAILINLNCFKKIDPKISSESLSHVIPGALLFLGPFSLFVISNRFAQYYVALIGVAGIVGLAGLLICLQNIKVESLKVISLAVLVGLGAVSALNITRIALPYRAPTSKVQLSVIRNIVGKNCTNVNQTFGGFLGSIPKIENPNNIIALMYMEPSNFEKNFDTIPAGECLILNSTVLGGVYQFYTGAPTADYIQKLNYIQLHSQLVGSFTVPDYLNDKNKEYGYPVRENISGSNNSLGLEGTPSYAFGGVEEIQIYRK